MTDPVETSHQQRGTSSPAFCKRVLFVDQTAQLGGAELCLRDLLLARKANDRVVLLQHGPFEELLSGAGVDVVVKTLGGHGQEIRKESGLLSKLGASADVYRTSRAVARVANDMDVIYANTPKALVIAALASWLSRKPLIYHLHDILSIEHFSRSNLRLLVTLCNWSASRVIANSEASKVAFMNAGGRTPVSVCYNGFDPTPFDQWYRDRERHRSRLRTTLNLKDEPVVAVFGRFAPWKGQHVAIEAMRDLPGTHLLLIGDALFGEQEYKQQIEEMVCREGFSDRIHCLGFRNDVGPWMQAVDVVVHCSTAAEPFGRVIVEAMLSRRPVVASRAGGALEILEDGKTGLLASPGDSRELARCIRKLLAENADVSSQVDSAYRVACGRFGLQAISEQINWVIAESVR